MSMAAETLTSAPTLQDLLRGIAEVPPLPVSDIASDSRLLTQGAVMFAYRGASSHALQYIDDRNAGLLSGVVWDGDQDVTPPAGIPAFVVPDLQAQMPVIASRFFGDPSASLKVTGVTGTNGKTTVAWLLAQCWQRLGQRCGYIGTLGAGIDSVDTGQGLTTPDCIELQRLLAGFRDAEARRAVLEVSSHGLQQERVAGTTFDAAIFTNLSRDHIDYHGDMTRYGEAKARLFSEFAPRHRVICVDSEFGADLAGRFRRHAILVASDAGHDWHGARYVCASSIVPTPHGSQLAIDSSWGDGQFDLPLVGRFNVANALVVLALLFAEDVAFADALALLADCKAPAGRMQPVHVKSHVALPAVFVDYAHTPAALEAALQALRPHCRGRLWCVFGCGGERDRGKRPLMGRVAVEGADRAVLTSDNPRSESPAAIMNDVQQGVDVEITAIEDRAAAIAWTIAQAAADDTVLIAGKGHENYQLIAGERRAFSDDQAAAANLRRRR